MSLGISGRLTRATIQSPLTPLMLLAAILVGLLAILTIPREEEPQISVPMVDLMVAAPGLSASDAVELVGRATERLPLLVDQGDADEFLGRELKPQLLREACDASGHPLELRLQPGYDHSYYFISTFIGDHIAWHARHLAG